MPKKLMPKKLMPNKFMSNKFMSKKIAVVGTVNRDTIRAADGVVTESYGGLLYSVLPLAAIAESDAVIFPLCNLGEDASEKVLGFLKRCDSIDISGVEVVAEKNNHCIIQYYQDGHKDETLLGGVPALTYERLEPFLDCDAICFNFISGFEISINDLKKVKRFTDALIFMDVHSLTLGIDSNRKRFQRKPDSWEEWFSETDVVQMNEAEAELLYGSKIETKEDFVKFGRKLLNLGSDGVIITHGGDGSICMYRGVGGKMALEKTDAFKFEQVLDQTGCGDVFLAAFAWEYLKTGDFPSASVFANKAAGSNCCLRGIEETYKIRDYLTLTTNAGE